MIFVTAFFLRPYAFWLAAGVATAIYGGLGWALVALWHHGYRWVAGAIGILVLASAWKYLAILNQEIASAEQLECEALLWVMRIPGLGGHGLYALSHLGAGLLVFFGIAIPAWLATAPPLLILPPALAAGFSAIAYRLRHHPIARQFTFAGMRRDKVSD